MIVRRTPDGALKCAFRAFLRDELIADEVPSQRVQLREVEQYVHVLIFVIAAMVVISSGANCVRVEIFDDMCAVPSLSWSERQASSTRLEKSSRFVVRSKESIAGIAHRGTRCCKLVITIDVYANGPRQIDSLSWLASRNPKNICSAKTEVVLASSEPRLQ